MSSVHTLGVPIRSVNWVRIFPTLDAEDRDCLVAVMGQQADGFMVVKVASLPESEPLPTMSGGAGVDCVCSGLRFVGWSVVVVRSGYGAVWVLPRYRRGGE